MSKKDKKTEKKTATTTAPATEKAAKGSKLKVRELTEEEVGEVAGGAGGLAAFCQDN